MEELCELYPQADIYTHVAAPEMLSQKLRNHPIKTTFISQLPAAKRMYQKYLPLMPRALEELDLRGYDLVISSESGPAKGVITEPKTLHVCYCHTPMRYMWNMYHDYKRATGPLTGFAMSLFMHRMRLWDYASAARVDYFVANSSTVAERIRKYYRRESEIIHPPVNVDAFGQGTGTGEFYLLCGELAGYKRADIAIEAFNNMKKPLVVIGSGEQLKLLKQMAGPTVQILGSQPFEVLKDHYARCRALIFPGEEDFGIVPLEAMASGRPVIAYGRGGALDTVVPNRTGLFFDNQTANALIETVHRFEEQEGAFNPEHLIAHAQSFSSEVFREKFGRFIENRIEQHHRT